MEPVIIILVSGLLGGIVLALLIINVRIGSPSPGDGRRLEPLSPGLINMAHIRVEGVGGLGLVAMAVTVATFEPRIRFAMAIALPLGVALAAVLIALRRRTGPLSSSSHHPGAHSMLPNNGSPRRAEPVRVSQPTGNDRPLRADLAGSVVPLTVAR
jgi:hypothetical protein